MKIKRRENSVEDEGKKDEKTRRVRLFEFSIAGFWIKMKKSAGGELAAGIEIHLLPVTLFSRREGGLDKDRFQVQARTGNEAEPAVPKAMGKLAR